MKRLIVCCITMVMIGYTQAQSTEMTQVPIVNNYGLSALWEQGDFVTRGTLIFLLLMSLSSWIVIISKIIEQTQFLRIVKSLVKIEASALFESLRNFPQSPFNDIVESGIRAKDQSMQMSKLDPNLWIATAVDDAVERLYGKLQSGMALLATVSSTSPFVGLFGTVCGIYHALTAIGVTGQASIEKVAGPVGEALIMTAFGLAVAVPAVLGYNWLLRRNRHILDFMRLFGNRLHAELVMVRYKD